MHTGTNHRAPCRGGAAGGCPAPAAGLRGRWPPLAQWQLATPTFMVRQQPCERRDFTVVRQVTLDGCDQEWMDTRTYTHTDSPGQGWLRGPLAMATRSAEGLQLTVMAKRRRRPPTNLRFPVFKILGTRGLKHNFLRFSKVLGSREQARHGGCTGPAGSPLGRPASTAGSGRGRRGAGPSCANGMVLSHRGAGQWVGPTTTNHVAEN